MQDRRSERRMLCADMFQVQWIPVQGTLQRSTALLEDISPSGACLQLEMEVPVGSRISWEAAQHKFAGRVRYCVYREIGYFVGVEFAHNVKWSESAYQPNHLLDIEKFLRES
jgi:hypothetical protein